MKYVSLKQQQQDTILLYDIVSVLEQYHNFTISYESDALDYWEFNNSIRIQTLEGLRRVQNIALDFVGILLEDAFLPEQLINTAKKVIIRKDHDYPGATKPYYITLLLPEDYHITLKHVHYYQSEVIRPEEDFHHAYNFFEEYDTVYYDVKDNYIKYYPFNIDNDHKKNENFWGKYNPKYNNFVIHASKSKGMFYFTRQKRFLQYYNMFHPQD